MKRGIAYIVASVFLLMISFTAYADLHDRGDGLIYDDKFDITWLQDANYARTIMTWNEAMDWAETLVYAGYDDWRLPSAMNQDGTGPCQGFYCDGSEMGHLYYDSPPDGFGAHQGFPPSDTGPFYNLEINSTYWSSTEYPPDPAAAKQFSFYNGGQGQGFKDNHNFAWAVRDGDSTPIPENQPPIANAGPDQTVNEGEKVTLDGTGSTDPNDDIVSYLWEQLDGPGVTLTGADTFLASFTAPNVGPSGKVLTFQLTVTDSGGLQGTDTCTVSVEPFPWELFYPAFIRGK